MHKYKAYFKANIEGPTLLIVGTVFNPGSGKLLNKVLCIVLCLGLSIGVSKATAQTDNQIEQNARAIHQRVMTLDTHVDIPFNFATGEVDPANQPAAQVDLQKMRAGGLDAAFFIVYVGQTERTEVNYARARRDALTKFDAIHRMTDDLYGDLIGFADTAAEARRLHAAGKLVAMIGIENGYVIGKDLSALADFRQRGARYMTLVHNGHNDIGDSAQPQARLGDALQEHGGLSEFGYQVVEELNRLGILVDISHVSRQTMLDATAHSIAPVVASHSGVTGVADHARNMNDEQLMALKENGGVVQLVAFDSYVKLVQAGRTEAIADLRRTLGIQSLADTRELSAQDRQRYDDQMAVINVTWPSSNVSDFVDHIDYAVKLIGIDHVGISSDFGGGGGVQGWNSADETFNVTLELVRRGYSEDDIGKMWSGNLLRILQEAEQIAEATQ